MSQWSNKPATEWVSMWTCDRMRAQGLKWLLLSTTRALGLFLSSTRPSQSSQHAHIQTQFLDCAERRRHRSPSSVHFHTPVYFLCFCMCVLLIVPLLRPRRARASVTSWSPAAGESHQACTVCLTDVCLLCWLAYFGGQRLEVSWIIHRNCLIFKHLTFMSLCSCRRTAEGWSFFLHFCLLSSPIRRNVKQCWRFSPVLF